MKERFSLFSRIIPKILRAYGFNCATGRQLYKFFFLLFTFSLFLFTFSLSHATIRYVSKTGLSIPPYTSWATAADSIQECINICVFGDTIYVANGVYEEQVVMIPGLSLIGAGFDSCMVDTRSLAYSGFHSVIVKDSCLFRDFQVIVANQDVGYGIKGEGQTGLIIMNKVRDGAGGIYLNLSDIAVVENICLNNRIGIIVDYSNSVVRNNIIESNYESDDGINISDLSHTKSPTISFNYIETNAIGIFSHLGTKTTKIFNNIIVLIEDAGGINILSADTVGVFNNLIIAKEYLTSYGGISTWGLPRIIGNNLIYGSKEAGGTGISMSGPTSYLVQVINNSIIGGEYGIRNFNPGDVPAYYNNIWNTDVNFSGFTPDTTNLSVDPMIVNDDTTQGELDFHLQMFSPLIDAGDPLIIDKDSTRSDIGLYGGPFGESYIYLDLPPRPPVNLTAQVDSNIITLNWNRNTEADFRHYNLYRDTTKNFQIDSTKLVASLEDTFYLHLIPANVESLYFKLTAVDNQGNESNPSEEIFINLTSVTTNELMTINDYRLYQNYPNPFNPSTKIGYRLKERGYVKLYVYDIKGELVSVLVNQTQEAGYYEVEFDGSVGSRQSAVGNGHSGLSGIGGLASGIYIYQIMVRSQNDPSKPGPNGVPVFSDIKKMILLR